MPLSPHLPPTSPVPCPPPQLYVVPAAAEGEGLPLLGETVVGLYLSDEGRPLWAAPGVEPDEGGAVTLVLDQVRGPGTQTRDGGRARRSKAWPGAGGEHSKRHPPPGAARHTSHNLLYKAYTVRLPAVTVQSHDAQTTARALTAPHPQPPVVRLPCYFTLMPALPCCWAVQEGECGPCWPLPPTLQFLDKTSSFRAGGRRLEGFRLLVRVVAPPAPGPGGAISGAGAGEVVLAQAASTPFKVRPGAVALCGSCGHHCFCQLEHVPRLRLRRSPPSLPRLHATAC